MEQRYLHKRSFPFAREAAVEAALCGREMCNPNHEHEDAENDWGIEDDVSPPSGDNWIRMSLPRPKTAQVTASRTPSIESHGLPASFRPRSAPGVGTRKRLSPSSQNSETSSYTSRSGSKLNNALVPSSSITSSVTRSDTKRVGLFGKVKDDRAFPIPDVNVVDEDDERVRREQARQASQKLKEAEMEKQRLLEEEAEAQRQEEKRRVEVQDKRLRTYDSAGKVIWIHEPDPEELPNIQEYFDIDVETSPNDNLAEIPLMSSLPVKRPVIADAKLDKKDPRKSLNRSSSRRFTQTRRSRATRTEDFTDGFYRHENMQPPVTSTMKMQGGVVLECMGVKKGAPLPPKVGQRMSRTQYLNMVRRRDEEGTSVGDSVSDAGSTASGQRKSSKVRPQSAPVVSKKFGLSTSTPLASKGSKDFMSNAQGEEEYVETVTFAQPPPSPPARVPLFMGTIHPEMNQKAPPAPWIGLRNKDRSLTGDAQPRNRGIFIGSVNTQNGRTGPIQPPLGAVMGHGLLHSVSQRDAFYFPHFPASPGHTSAVPSSPPSARIRTSSEPVLAGRKR